MDFRHNSETPLNPPSPWFVLCQFLAIYSNLILATIGIVVIVDRVMPGRTLTAELVVAAAVVLWQLLMRKLGALPRPRRPKNGARAVVFVAMFVSFSSFLLLFDWWEPAPQIHWQARIVGMTLGGLFFAGFMSLRQKGIWLEESVDAARANQTPPLTV